jgi:hypothetical protein
VMSSGHPRRDSVSGLISGGYIYGYIYIHTCWIELNMRFGAQSMAQSDARGGGGARREIDGISWSAVL